MERSRENRVPRALRRIRALERDARKQTQPSPFVIDTRPRRRRAFTCLGGDFAGVWWLKRGAKGRAGRARIRRRIFFVLETRRHTQVQIWSPSLVLVTHSQGKPFLARSTKKSGRGRHFFLFSLSARRGRGTKNAGEKTKNTADVQKNRGPSLFLALHKPPRGRGERHGRGRGRDGAATQCRQGGPRSTAASPLLFCLPR